MTSGEAVGVFEKSKHNNDPVALLVHGHPVHNGTGLLNHWGI